MEYIASHVQCIRLKHQLCHIIHFGTDKHGCSALHPYNLRKASSQLTQRRSYMPGFKSAKLKLSECDAFQSTILELHVKLNLQAGALPRYMMPG